MLEPSPVAPVSSSGPAPDGDAADPVDPQPSLPRILGVVLGSGVVPGTGHLATGHKRSGRVLVALSLLLIAAAAVAGVAVLRSPARAASLAVQPHWLTLLRWGVPALAAGWILVVLWATVLVRPGRRGAAGRVVAGLAVLVVVAAVAVPAAEVSRYAGLQLAFVNSVFKDAPVTAPGAPKPAAADVPIKNGRLNVLLVGSDAGPDRTGVRTDTMILASLDTRSGRTVLFTLPRNLERVPFTPGSVMAKQFPNGFVGTCAPDCLLNAVYHYAATNRPDLVPGDPDPGMTALRSAVTAILGVPIDYQANVDLAGFSKLVDALGGVTIRVERRLPIGGLDAFGNHVRPSGYIQAGLQHMNGDTALAYARSRSDSSDYERVQRQRCLLGAIQRQADPTNVLANFSQLASSTADALQTDIPRSLLPDLVKLAFKVKSQPVLSLTFTPPLINTARPDFTAIRAAVQAALVAPPTTGPSSPSPSSPSPSSTSPSPSSTSPSPSTSPSSGATPTPSAPSTPPGTPVSVADVCQYS